MQYHIQTTPIYDAFKSGCDCPMCEIYAKSSGRLVDQYLNEAVMEPEYRVQVNKFGFCVKHIKQLFEGKNKLGLALQLHTRTSSVMDKMNIADTFKQAKKQADELLKSVDSCVICNSVDEMMQRYAYTIAQMYTNEKDFVKLFRDSNGFCLPHYILLLNNSNKAGGKIKEYLNDLTGLQLSTTAKINSDTDRFTQKFDYRNNGSGGVPDPNTIPGAIKKLKGRIIG